MRETATLEQLKEIVEILSAEFNVTPPQVDFSRRRVAHYRVLFRRIYFPTIGSWRGFEFTMLHEFAHHLVEVTLTREEKRRIRDHGPVFRDALHKVAAAWYGDPDRYSWKTEYKSIAEWHKKKGGKHGHHNCNKATDEADHEGGDHANDNRATQRDTGAGSGRASGVCCPPDASATGGAGPA